MKELPKRKDYESFLEGFTNRLSREHPDCCLFLYGSITNGSCDYGRSDIDGCIILDSGVVTPKDKILSISKIFAEALKYNRVKTQFNLTDRQTNRNGKFLSYTTDYTDWFKDCADISCGPDYVLEMNGLDFKSSCLSSAAFNLRKARRSALKSLDNFATDIKEFQKSIIDSLELFAKFPKKLIWLQEENVIASRYDARIRFSEMLNDLDLSTLDEINILLGKPTELYKQIENSGGALDLLIKSLEGIELMIESYLRKFPEPSERELKL